MDLAATATSEREYPKGYIEIDYPSNLWVESKDEDGYITSYEITINGYIVTEILNVPKNVKTENNINTTMVLEPQRGEPRVYDKYTYTIEEEDKTKEMTPAIKRSIQKKVDEDSELQTKVAEMASALELLKE